MPSFLRRCPSGYHKRAAPRLNPSSHLCLCRWTWPWDRTSSWSPHSPSRRRRPRSLCLRHISSVLGCRSRPWRSGILLRRIRSQMAALKQKPGMNGVLTDLRWRNRENSAEVSLYSIYRYLSWQPGKGWLVWSQRIYGVKMYLNKWVWAFG